MGFLIGALCVVLLVVFIVQIGKAKELVSAVRNDDSEQYEINNFNAGLGIVFVAAFLGLCIWSFIHYIPTSLGWGPNTAASEHGTEIDFLFNLTLFFTGIVFFVTQFLLFWFAWKYRGQKGRRAVFFAHNETLEVVWMAVPAIVMTFLVVGGLQAWNNIMSDVRPGDEYMEIEATGFQFGWELRYPGRDAEIGSKHFKRIRAGKNSLGQQWEDVRNIDDFIASDLVLLKGQKVRVRITAKDVLHNFYIRDMRVKMDAVPGMPTYFIFTPTVTTDSMRRRLSERPEWNIEDPKDDTKKRWETFNYELACAELCGKGHYTMRKIVRVVEEDEFYNWLDEQEGGNLDADALADGEFKLDKSSIKSTYYSSIANDEKQKEFNTVAEEDQKVLANYEVNLLNKAVVNHYMAQLKDLKTKAKTTEEKKALTNALLELVPVQKVVRMSNDVAKTQAQVEIAKSIADKFIAPVAPVVDEVATDSTATTER